MYAKENIILSSDKTPIKVYMNQFNNWNNTVKHIGNEVKVTDKYVEYSRLNSKYKSLNNCQVIATSNLLEDENSMELTWTNSMDNLDYSICLNDVNITSIKPYMDYYSLNIFSFMYLIQSLIISMFISIIFCFFYMIYLNFCWNN